MIIFCFLGRFWWVLELGFAQAVWLRHCAGFSCLRFWESGICGIWLALDLVYFIDFVGVKICRF